MTSEAQLKELRRVLRYSRLKKHVPKHVSGALINRLQANADFVKPVKPRLSLQDDDDLLILGTAIAGKADWLVTGDKAHLLALKRYAGITILTPKEAVHRLGVRHGR
ncbi:putative toxin-antitoxin system toxin component, PIN family [Marinithermus hydrothermalis]|uniref:putative toxin-antitoxin system toxin component, PIN family n=1 Tax=Marinithermus hydrothermalis TaxID=186192 RepID=UPI001FE1D2C2|nr:putative toxin-antitoxin system toxin component, PIN family [Marinithermus hydrothermalis]